MAHIILVCDSDVRASELIARFGNEFELKYLHASRLADAEPAKVSLIDIDLRRAKQINDLHQWIERQPKGNQIIFAVERASRFESVQAVALGATAVLGRPIKREQLASLLNTRKTLADASTGFDGPRNSTQFRSVKALQTAFSSAINGTALDINLLHAAGVEIDSRMEEQGLQNWLEAVRSHHSLTYQHCLIVTAVAVSFGQRLGFNKRDRERIATAGLLHDIGKAKISLDILEKPGPLNEDEWVIMRMHPQFGVQALESAPGLAPEMIEIVRNHHEYLDGSGYPNGLSGSQISDLVRVMTICDIYGALIERRSYKSPLTASAAYSVLKNMGSKLDQDMVREFEGLTLSIS